MATKGVRSLRQLISCLKGRCGGGIVRKVGAIFIVMIIILTLQLHVCAHAPDAKVSVADSTSPLTSNNTMNISLLRTHLAIESINIITKSSGRLRDITLPADNSMHPRLSPPNQSSSLKLLHIFFLIFLHQQLHLTLYYPSCILYSLPIIPEVRECNASIQVEEEDNIKGDSHSYFGGGGYNANYLRVFSFGELHNSKWFVAQVREDSILTFMPSTLPISIAVSCEIRALHHHSHIIDIPAGDVVDPPSYPLLIPALQHYEIPELTAGATTMTDPKHTAPTMCSCPAPPPRRNTHLFISS
ncbi:uncharacterized protein BDR25DRAFT_358186 [Lindgomyces ingoldianus]|uniref:Uncharacterized protein n=1 Tax=Lindgomyces ingoldianus TaxID=673940 RepID=A0ACB6QM04_9PLEO|nr:uncharacterized protein BDR25DRAFT_358186 [Lindgomyces ingoldianus]KAF2467936.1 hypothetical protein BDR25DRAFT_358186 [Lindgomyces ingoldianus]